MIPIQRSSFAVVCAFLVLTLNAYANPQGATVVAGSATFNTSTPNTLTVTTASDKTIINYNSFSIASNESTVFNQPSASSAVLNRVVGIDPSLIYGNLSSNGKLFLVNPNGVIFGPGSEVNAPAIVASTLDIRNDDFLNGNYSFTKNGRNAYIINQGRIATEPGGYVALLSQAVDNQGVILADSGSIALASGNKMTLALDALDQISVVVDDAVKSEVIGPDGQKITNAISNSGTIQANGGKVILNAQVMNDVFDYAVNNTGVLQANAIQDNGGDIELTSSGAINNNGIIQAGTVNEQGETFISSGILDIDHGFFTNLDGAINISGSISGTYSDTGNINFTGAVSLAGDSTLQADDTGSQTGEVVMNTYSLTGNNFDLTLYTGVNDTLDGSITGVNLLTLNSSTANNKTFTSTGSSFSVNTLKTNYYSLFSRSQGSGTSGDPYMIYSDSNVQGGLQYIPTQSLSAYYELANNIDATETSNWNSGSGFDPIGASGSPFTGTFNGNNYTISNLFINLPLTNYVGLFGYTSGSTISNVGLTNVNITGDGNVAGLVGANYYSSSISNSFVTGSVTGNEGVGGLVGESYSSSSISDSYASGSVTGTGGNDIGGLVGEEYSASISDSYATGTVSGSGGEYMGGLVGYNYESTLSDSYATGSVTQTGSGGDIGGLVGINYGSSTISDSYATGDASGNIGVGGLVGENLLSSSISDSYSTGAVTGTGGNQMGGLVGENYDDASISNSYATGTVSGSSGDYIGGLVGDNKGGATISNSYDTSSVSGSGSDIGGLIGHDDGSNTLTNNWWYNSLSNGIGSYGPNTSTGHWEEAGSASDFFNPSQAVYTGTSPWDISSSTGHTWAMAGDNQAYPLLQFRYSTTISDDYQLQLMFLDLGASYSLANNVNASETSNWNSGSGFDPIGASGSPFTGTFNGNNYTISNLFINLPLTNYVGLFGYTSGSTISNVGLTNVNITGDGNVAGLVGANYYSSSISNSFVTGSVTGNEGVGGLVGESYSSSSISDSYASGSVTGTGGNDIGGLVGEEYSASISDSYATGTVSGSGGEYMGGLVGYNYESTLSDSYATGSVTQTGSGGDIGGLVGINYGSSTISDSYATGDASGNIGVGGLVGENLLSSSISDSYASGSVTGTGGNDIGGLVGEEYSASISDSYATGTVSGSGGDYMGGLVGYNYESTLSGSHSTGSVTQTGSGGDIGGLVGINYGSSTISDSYATGDASGNIGVGGLVGENLLSSSISDSYSTGAVTGTGGNQMGGLVGENYDASISNSYATGTVSGSSGDYIGGLVGDNKGGATISNSYDTSSVSGSGSDIGGLIGHDDGSNTLTNNWWYNSLSNGIGSYGPNTSTGHWEEASADSDFYSSSQAVYTGASPWDFATIWYTPSSAYPQLR